VVSEQAQRLTLSIPPERWETVEPPAGTAFLAQRIGAFQYFRPTISVEVAELQPDATLTDVAGVLFGKLQRIDPQAEGRIDTSRLEAGRVLQRVRFTLNADGLPPLHLEQWQVVVAMDTDDPSVTLAMTIVLTAEADTMNEYVADFQEFVGSATVTEGPVA
jgi:hypothetical protein